MCFIRLLLLINNYISNENPTHLPVYLLPEKIKVEWLKYLSTVDRSLG